ncbi:hypothetical protein WSM22_23210 [Cytophagales bacterium WSM2-2]|nr:hypothetical protein WSM22_23210 [Cytophagales bacterium WSM2-2]
MSYRIYNEQKTNSYKRELYKDYDYTYYINLNNKGERLSGPHWVEHEAFKEMISTHKLQKSDPFKIFTDEDDISDSDKNIRDERLDLISTIINTKPKCYDKKWVALKAAEIIKERSQVDDETRQKKKITKYKVISAVLRYQASGEVNNGLLPNYRNSGGAGKERQVKNKRLGRKPQYESGHEMSLTREDKRRIQKFYRKHKVKNNHAAQREAYDKFYTKHYLGKEKYPTFKQFLHWGLKIQFSEQSKLDAVGEIRFNKDYRSLTGSARKMIFGPGSEAQFDSTKDDTHSLSMVIPNTYIGRLTLFLMVDSFSSMPMGISLVPDSASYETASLTMVNCVTDKEKWCRSLGIHDMNAADWPVEHLAARIFADRGLLLGPKAKSVINNLHIQVDNAESFRPDMKSIIERHIGKLLKKIAGTLEGYGLVNKKDSPRISPDARLEAVLNYEEILAIMVKEILYFIKHEPIEGYPLTKEMEACELYPTALNIWNFGIDNNLESLLYENPEELRIKLLEQKDCSFDKGGILFQGYKWTPVTEDGLTAFNEMRFGGKRHKASLSFDASDTSQVYFRYQNSFHQLKPIQNDVHVRSFWELMLNRDKRRVKKRLAEPDRLTAAAEKIKFQEGIIQRAIARKNANGRTVDIKSANSTRAVDKTHYKKQGPFAKKIHAPKGAAISKAPAKDSLKMPSFIEQLRQNGL